MELRSLEPFLNPVQVRILLALRDGPKTERELAALLHREVRTIRKHSIKLHRWGLTGSRLYPRRQQVLRESWPKTLAHLCHIADSHTAGVRSAIMDLADAPPIAAFPPVEDGREDILAYIHEVRKRGP